MLICYCHRTESKESLWKATVLFYLLQNLLPEQMLHTIPRLSYLLQNLVPEQVPYYSKIVLRYLTSEP